MPIHEFAANPVSVPALSDDLFGSTGYVVTDPRGLLAAVGADGALSHSLPVVQGGVQSAPKGAIQDPAGSAVGTGRKPTGGGGSGAIYAAFPDLAPVPDIQPRSAIFNSSTGPGERVLHSYSPRLGGTPTDAEARRQALEDLANTYANAILAFNDRAAGLGAGGAMLNLVPVAAVIFGGQFVDPSLGRNGHLHPSYSIPAVYLAASALEATGTPIPEMALYYYDADVFAVGQDVASKIGGS